MKNYLLQHLHAISQSFQNARRTPVVSGLTLAVISLALVLPTLLFMILGTVTPIVKNMDTGSSIAVYLKLGISDKDAQFLVEGFKQDSDFSRVTFVSAAQGLEEFSKAAGFGSAFATLKNNPLPAVIELQPAMTDPTQLEVLQKKLSAIANVDQVQFDTEWIKRLFAIINLVKHFVYGLAFILLAAVLLIIGNTIRSLVQSHQSEIVVLKLLGASRQFISRPFLYAGVIYGLLAGFVTIALAFLFMHWLQIPANTLANLYHTELHLEGISFLGCLMLLGISMALGLFGAWLALTQHVLDVEI